MRIVVGYVNTPESRTAFDWAIPQAKCGDVHIVSPHSIRGGGSRKDEQAEIIAYCRELDAIEAEPA